jgi:hypothetical protein
MPQCTPKRGDGLLFAKQIATGFCNDLSRLTLIARHSNDDSEHCADQRVEHGMTGLAATEAAENPRGTTFRALEVSTTKWNPERAAARQRDLPKTRMLARIRMMF